MLKVTEATFHYNMKTFFEGQMLEKHHIEG